MRQIIEAYVGHMGKRILEGIPDDRIIYVNVWYLNTDDIDSITAGQAPSTPIERQRLLDFSEPVCGAMYQRGLAVKGDVLWFNDGERMDRTIKFSAVGADARPADMYILFMSLSERDFPALDSQTAEYHREMLLKYGKPKLFRLVCVAVNNRQYGGDSRAIEHLRDLLDSLEMQR